jgi:hypothetical protein
MRTVIILAGVLHYSGNARAAVAVCAVNGKILIGAQSRDIVGFANICYFDSRS